MNHDNFTEVTSGQAPDFLSVNASYGFALGYNTCLERTNAAELLQCLIEFTQAKNDPDWLFENHELILRIQAAIKKATDEK